MCGLDDEAPAGMVKAMRPDMLGTWLPWALASLVQGQCAAAGAQPPKLDQIMRSWGLDVLADEVVDDETDRTLEILGL